MRQALQEANVCRPCPLLSPEMGAIGLLLLQTWELS